MSKTDRPEDPASRAGPKPSGSASFLLRSIGGGIAGKDIALDDLLENTTDAVILIDSQDVVSFWNRGAERMFQFGRDEVVGRRAGFIVPPDLLEAGELEWLQRQIEREGAIHNHVTRRVRKDGRELWVSLSRTALHGSDGEILGSTATIRDITEHRDTEEELHRARGLAMVGELAATIAHEIKNPLAGIYAAIQVLGGDVAADDPRREIFDEVGREVRRLDETVQDLLRFARPNPPKPMATDVSSFVTPLVDNLRHQPDLDGHAIEVDVEDDLAVFVDHRLMAQVITNLVLNAAQAMTRAGTIRLTATRQRRKVLIEVADTGKGIDADRLETVFDPFFTTKTRGTGLGLSIARKNVEAHDGTITAHNRAAGGARFLIELPTPEEGLPVDED